MPSVPPSRQLGKTRQKHSRSNGAAQGIQGMNLRDECGVYIMRFYQSLLKGSFSPQSWDGKNQHGKATLFHPTYEVNLLGLFEGKCGGHSKVCWIA